MIGFRSYSRYFAKRVKAILCIICLMASLLTMSLVNAARAEKINPTSTVHALLQVNINADNKFSGKITLNFQNNLTTTNSLYIILPFRISNVETDNENFNATFSVVSYKYSFLNMVIAPTAPQELNVKFNIDPSFIDPTDLNASNLDHSPNFLVIENKGSGRQTLYFRLNTRSTDQPFGRLTVFNDAMLIPSEIRFQFPTDTDFYNSISKTRPSNISEGIYPGIEFPTEFLFSTKPDFYQDGYLWINYSLPSPTFIPPNAIPLAILGLCSMGLAILATPEEILSKSKRLFSATICVVLVPVLLLINCILGGASFILKDLAIAIPAGIMYLLLLILVFSNVIPLMRKKLKDRKTTK